MLLLRRRNPCIQWIQTAPNNTSDTATFGAALQAGDLVFAFHRWAGTTPSAAPTVATNLLDTNIFAASSVDLSWGIAVGGETTVNWGVGSTVRCSAVAYRGARISQNLQSVKVTGSGTATVPFPTLTLRDPGRSWVAGFVGTNALDTHTSTTLTNRAGVGLNSYIATADTNGPRQVFTGETYTLSTAQIFAAWAVEIVSL